MFLSVKDDIISFRSTVIILTEFYVSFRKEDWSIILLLFGFLQWHWTLYIIMMQNYKKQGLEQTQNQLFCQQRKIFTRGIPRTFIIKTKIDPQHLTCVICQNILWKAVACSQQNCFANFCQFCLDHSQESHSKDSESSDEENNRDAIKNCPKCKKSLQKTTIPLINNLLSDITLRCPYSAYGCEQIIAYDGYLKHLIQCQYRKLTCEGCNSSFLKKELQQHKIQCEMIIVQCQKCYIKFPQLQFKQTHTSIKCLQTQLNAKSQLIRTLQAGMDQLKNRLISYENVIDKIIKGETIPLKIQFYSSFPYNFHFSANEAKLIKSSWNQQKEKFDFLHFYLTSSIKTQSPVGFQWRINVKVLKGNLLIGICSSLSTNSVDFVINRFGEIKKKQSTQNKYKLIRKSNLTFNQGDTITFKYLALRKILKIQNQTKRLQNRLQAKQIFDIGQNLYSFYSLDTIHDCIRFI